jgi:hypothetical protein
MVVAINDSTTAVFGGFNEHSRLNDFSKNKQVCSHANQERKTGN